MTKLIDEIKREDSFEEAKFFHEECRRLASEKSNLENAVSIAKHEFINVKLNEGESVEKRMTAIWVMERKIEAIDIVVKDISDLITKHYAAVYRSEIMARKDKAEKQEGKQS